MLHDKQVWREKMVSEKREKPKPYVGGHIYESKYLNFSMMVLICLSTRDLSNEKCTSLN